MNMFKRKSPSPQEVIRQTNLKRNITKQFSKVLKILQQRHMNADDPIYSDDEANSLCNILEAVFLHGLKDSMASKLVNYVGLGTQSSDNTITVNFWSFAVKFTHKDVVEQLRSLAQISSEIGLCRAWVRLALNDGLMESYLHSVIGDSKTLQYYYHTTAYLRDHEQPDILKSYLSGLMNLTFQLSFNSSVLNHWTSSPLVLAGLVDSQTPTPIFNVNSKTEPVVSADSKATSPSRSIKSKSREHTDVDIVDTRHDGLHPPPNTPYDVQGFTRADVEAIKKLTLASSPYNASECSTSSHISCPDPSNGAATSFDTLAIENEILEQIMALNEAEVRQAKDSKDFSRTMKATRLPKPKHKRVTEPGVNSEQRHSPKVNRKSAEKDSEALQQAPAPEDSVSELKGKVEYERERTPETNSCDNADSIPTDTIEDIKTTNEISLYDVPDEEDWKNFHSKDRTKVKPKLPPLDKTLTNSVYDEFTPPTSPNKCKSSPAQPELSSAVADRIETAPLAEARSSLLAVRERIAQSDKLSTPASSDVSEFDNGSDVLPGSPRSIGNKLSSMSGWSSEFESSGEYLSEKNLARLQSSTDATYTKRPKAESFGTLLHNYIPTNTPATGPSLDQVIQNLPSSSASDLDSVDASETPRRVMKTQLSEDPVDEEYEIVVSQMTNFDSSSNPNSRLTFFRELAVEKGLDSQNYQCKACTRPVGIIYGSPRVCAFDGGYYCFECHENDECYIPANIIYNWDFRKMKVAKGNLEFIQQMEDQPIIDLEELNPKAYEHVAELEEVRVLRQQLCSLKTYLFTCQQTVAVDLRKKIWPREHLYDSRHMYSVTDLLQVSSGQLSKFLKEVIKFACKHVYDCSLCSQKGFICEVCNNAKVIYPFQVDSTYRCLTCKAVYHKTCMTENLPCPKCTRWRLRKGSFGPSPADSEDYAITPP